MREVLKMFPIPSGGRRALFLMLFTMLHALAAQEEQKLSVITAFTLRDDALIMNPSLKEESEAALVAWLEKRKDLVEKVLTLDVCGPVEERKKRLADLTADLQQAKMPSLVKDKFIFRVEVVPGEAYLLKIPSMPIRRSNYNANLLVLKTIEKWKKEEGTDETSLYERPVIQAENPFAELSRGDYTYLEERNGLVTYQGLSRLAQRITMAEYLKEHPTDLVALPESHMVHLPWRPKDVDDRNYVVFEREVESPMGHGDDCPAILLKAVPVIEELIKKTGLWDISAKQFMIDKQGRVVPIDLEQPCNMPYHYFFNRHPEKLKNDIAYGLEGLKKMKHELLASVTRTILERRPSVVLDMIKSKDKNKAVAHKIVDDVASLGIPREGPTK